MVIGWTGQSERKESAVKSVKAKWTISVERERTLSQKDFLYDEKKWFIIERFPESMNQESESESESRWVNERSSRSWNDKKRKKADATASTQASLCVDAIAFDAAFFFFFFAILSTLSWKFGKTQPRQSEIDIVCPGPKWVELIVYLPQPSPPPPPLSFESRSCTFYTSSLLVF